MKKDLSIIADIFILIVFTIMFILRKNYEFLFYAAVLGLLIWVLAATDKVFRYTKFAKWGFTVWLFSHVSGGAFYFNGTKLYDMILIHLIGAPFNILRYDQLIHAFCYFVITLLVYSVVKKLSDKKSKPWLINTVVFLSAMGVSALNEIIEFSTVALFAATGVGGYYNNALDLIFNAIGIFIALSVVKKRWNR